MDGMEDIVTAAAAQIDQEMVALKAALKLPDSANATLVKARNACVGVCADALDAAAGDPEEVEEPPAPVADPTERRRAIRLAPQTLDRSKRMVEAVALSGLAPAGRPGPTPDGRPGPWIEELDAAGADLSRFIGGPVLKDHRATTDAVVGVVDTARVVDGRIIARVRFSPKPGADEVLNDIEGGFLRGVSMGFIVSRWTRVGQRDGRPVYRATAWTPHELSFTPVPVDAGAIVRSKPTMPDGTPFTPCPECATPKGCQKLGGCIVEAEASAADGGADGAGSTPAADGGAPDSTRALTNGQIRSLANIHGLTRGWVDRLIDRGASVAEARSLALDELAQRSNVNLRTDQPRAEVLGSHDDPRTRSLWMAEALYARANPQHALSEPARPYAYTPPADMARELLHLRGISTTGLSPAAVITRSLHTTSDFQSLLADTAGRTLRQAYLAAPSGLRRTARVVTAKDFRTRTSVQLSEPAILKRINESGEITAGTLVEAVETYRMHTFARKLRIARQALVNDDLGAFADLSRRFGMAGAETEAGEMAALLTMNAGTGPQMTDGKALFDVGHGNRVAPGGTVSVEGLSAGRVAMRTQKGLQGQLVSATPRFLVVPAALETEGEQMLAELAAAKVADVNPFTGKLELVVEPRLDAISATRWYLAADPAEIDGLEIAYLSGANGPMVESVRDPDVDGVTLQVIHDFGIGFVEYRSWYANEGA